MQLLSIILIISINFLKSHDIKYVKTEIDKEITVSLPEDFYPMSFEDIRQRVVSYRKALALYSDIDRLVEFGVNKAFSKWSTNDLELLQSFMKTSLLNLYTEVEMMEEGVREVNGRDYIFFEFNSRLDGAEDSKLAPIRKYSLLYYTLDRGQTILFTFSCRPNDQNYWQPVAKRIMSSIKIKPS